MWNLLIGAAIGWGIARTLDGQSLVPGYDVRLQVQPQQLPAGQPQQQVPTQQGGFTPYGR